MNTESMLKTRLEGSMRAVESLRAMLGQISGAAELLIGKLRAGGTVYTAGNGGSAAQSLHFAEELIGRYRSDRRPLRAVCLNADCTAVTCIANDYGFEAVFARQVKALAGATDVLVVLSTSGNSGNILAALGAARETGCTTIGLLGRGGGQARGLCSHAIVVAEEDSAYIQDAQQVIIHLLCEAVDRAFTEG